MKNWIHYSNVAKGILIPLLLIHHYGGARRRIDLSNK